MFLGAALSQIQTFSLKDAGLWLCTSLKARASALPMPKLLKRSSSAMWLDVLVDI